MNSELLAAVKERIALGHSKEAITAALEAAGYDRATIEYVYQEAHTDHARTAIPLADGVSGAQFAPSAEAAVLPSAWSLFFAGWRYARTRLDVVGMLAAVLIVLTVGGTVLAKETPTLSAGSTLVAALAVLAAFVLYLFLIIAVVRVITQSDVEQLSVSDALQWSKSHFLGFFWVGVLSGLVVLGGTLLFLIPGLIVSIYVYFSQYVYVKEGTTGMAAVVRSVQLTTGYWWALAWRSFLIGLLSLVVLIPVMVVKQVVTSVTGYDSSALLVVQALEQVASAVLVVIIMAAAYSLYQHLSTARPAETLAPAPAAWKYKALAWLGVVALLVFGLLAAFVSQFEDSLNTHNRLMVAAELSTARMTAGAYKVEHGTYAGVCASFQDEYIGLGTITCNDADDAWAFTVEIEEGQWCVDSTGLRKALASPLEERTECIAL